MRYAVWLLLLCLLPGVAQAQAASDPSFERDSLFATFGAFKDTLEAVAATGDAAALDAFWQTVQAAHQAPYVHGDSVLFMYRGSASTVVWNGDFNAWGGDPTFGNQGRQLQDADLWVLEQTFPPDARLDYKVVVNENQWMLDPANPLQQWSGFGPNSELRMPDYVYPQETVPRDSTPRGVLGDNVLIQSATLGYDVQYRVYTPAGYDTLSGLPVLYLTDGHEYAADHLGSARIVLDNVIADGLVPPILAVFVDPRQPGNLGNNRRQRQYADDYQTFAAFMADELVPAIDAAYRTDPSAEQRGILGTSLGGIFSAYLGAARPDVFRRIGIHSPAFSYDARMSQDRVYRMYADADPLPLKLFMSTGTIHDTEDGARRMKTLLEDKGYPLRYVEVNEGHSWGNWRALIDEPLRFFWGADVTLGAAEPPTPRDGLVLDSYPNPFQAEAVIAFRLPHAQRVSLDVYDLLGRRVQALLRDAFLAPGSHAVTVAARRWPSGVYLYRLQGESHAAAGQMLLLR